MKSFRNISTPVLTMSYLIIIALFIAFGIIISDGLLTQGSFTMTIYDHPLVVSNASLNAARTITKMHRSMKDVVLANSQKEIQEALNIVKQDEQEVYHQLNIIRSKILGEKGQKLEAQTRELFDNWRPIREEVVQLVKSENKVAGIKITKGKGADHVNKLEIKMLELTSYARNKADSFLVEAEKNQNHLERATIILTACGAFLSSIIAVTATYLMLRTENELRDEKDKLLQAINEIHTLRGIIPICSHCKNVRNDEGLWNRIEEYIGSHSKAEFSHGICPDCQKKHYPEFFEKDEALTTAQPD